MQGKGSPIGLAKLYLDLGDKQRAMDWLQKAYEERQPLLVDLRNGHDFDALRSDPRFQDLMRRMNFPP